MNPHNVVKTMLVGLFLAIMAVGSANGGTVMEAARTQSWDTQNLNALKALFSDKASVSAFIKELYKEVHPDLLDLEFGKTLCEYELTDLNNDNTVELVATLDSSGRLFCNEIIVVEKIEDVFHTFTMFAPGTSILDLKSRIVDLNHDGLKEILVPRLLAIPRFTSDPHAIINDVYAWDGAGYSKANVYFKNYYRSLLPRLKSELDAVREGRKLDVPSQKTLLEKKYEREIEEVNKILNE